MQVVDAVRAEPRAPAKRIAVVPFARALNLLGAFHSQDFWLGNRELADRTGLPPSTVSRIAASLVTLGYLHHEPVLRKYRLAASVLALGYAAVGSSEVQQVARAHMKAFASEHQVDVCLSSRDRLDMVVLESCRGAVEPIGINLRYGVRAGVASSPTGWALLASLPEPERYYLLQQSERYPVRDWPRQRRRASEAIRQVQERGFCAATAPGDDSVSIVAAPLFVAAQGPLVLACLAGTARMSRARSERELGPRLIAMTRRIHEQMFAQ
jgi:DNA-binding IclR family transcriptional regulator